MTKQLTCAQQRFLETIKSHGEHAEYWPVANDWIGNRELNFALRNINRTVDALIRKGWVELTDDGVFHLVP